MLLTPTPIPNLAAVALLPPTAPSQIASVALSLSARGRTQIQRPAPPKALRLPPCSLQIPSAPNSYRSAPRLSTPARSVTAQRYCAAHPTALPGTPPAPPNCPRGSAAWSPADPLVPPAPHLEHATVEHASRNSYAISATSLRASVADPLVCPNALPCLFLSCAES